MPRLLLDSGNILFKKLSTASLRKKEIEAAQTIAAVYREIHYDVLAVGPSDLAHGASFLLEELDELPWVSANLYDREGSRLFPAFKSLMRGTLKIGVVGLTGAILPESDLVVHPWKDELSVLMPQLLETHDLIIVLASLPYNELVAMAALFPGARIIIGADKRKGNVRPRLIHQSLITQTAKQGTYLGMLEILWRSAAWASNVSDKIEGLENQLRAAERYLARIKRLDLSKQQNQEKKRSVMDKITELKVEIAKAKSAAAALEQQLHPPSSFRSSLFPLLPSLEEAEQIRKIIDNGLSQLR